MRALLLACLFSPLLLTAAPQDRVHGGFESRRLSRLQGSVNPLARPEFDQGPVDSEAAITGISLDLLPSAEQQTALDTFLEAQRDPGSADYQRWLTPDEYADRFSLSASDIGQIASWLEVQGFTIEHVGAGRNWILFGGSAGRIERTFHTSLRHYQVESETHFANDTAPSIPAALTGIVGSIRGLDDFRPRPNRRVAFAPEYNYNGNHYLAPDDIAAIYNISPLYKAGFDGAGQKLAIIGQTDVDLADVRAFREKFGLPAKDPQVVLVGADPGVSRGDLIEADLDLEWSGAVARNATIIYVNSKNVFTSVQYAINQNLAPVISFSYGACEQGVPASFRSVAQQAAAQGITWMTSSGDSGAAGCDYAAAVAKNGPAVSFPADIPEIVAVGGTEFAESAGAGWASNNGSTFASATGYLAEKAWNDSGSGGGLAASGGGVSVLFPKPWWQTGRGVPDDKQRDVPDISLSASGAHDGYLVNSGGSIYVVGGTSASSPSFAGMVSILNQYLVANGALTKPGLGNLNPALYALAQNSTGIFHDITDGDNIVPCAAESKGCVNGSFGYKAGAGYDMVTGLGSVDAYNLVTKWSSLPAGVGTTTVLVAAPASIPASGVTQLTATVTAVSGANLPSGSVAFSAGDTALGSAAFTAGATASTATLAVKGSALAAGANRIKAAYTATGNFRDSGATVVVTVEGPVATSTTVTASPASLAATASTTVIVTVKAGDSTAIPAGSVALTTEGTPLGTATLSPNGTAAFTVKGTALKPGSNTIRAAYSALGLFSASEGKVAVTVTAPAASTATTLATSSAAIAQSATAEITVTVKSSPGATQPTGSVTLAAGTTALGTATLSGATAKFTVKGSSLAIGNNTLTAVYTGTSGFAPSQGTLAITVQAAPVPTSIAVTASPANFVQSASTQLSATVKASGGTASPSGSVTFAVNGKSLGTATLNAGTAVLTVQGSTFPTGNIEVGATYAASGNFATSNGMVRLTVTAPPAQTKATVTASPPNIAASGTLRLTVTVKSASGTADAAGIVTFTLDRTTLATAQLTPGIAGSSATVTLKGSSLPAGVSTITANYGGSADFAPATATVAVTVVSSTAARNR